jgi:hypothetical protein
MNIQATNEDERSHFSTKLVLGHQLRLQMNLTPKSIYAPYRQSLDAFPALFALGQFEERDYLVCISFIYFQHLYQLQALTLSHLIFFYRF